ncbi:uncharacterized protein LOC135930309 [Gordionus sp. m RMFG-2023]|uniref:uncharacterized protein LOC135930309 n=1 Tax=Gordionus sp. m RMFG-2023 TaxID=3053472 RepID=UPI0031FCD8DB
MDLISYKSWKAFQKFLHKIPFNKTKQWNVSYYQNLKKALLLQQERKLERDRHCRIKKRNEQSLIPTTSNHLEDTGNKQFASTSNHLEDTENQEQINISAQQSLVEEHYCGLLNTKCDYCDSLKFLLEKPTDGKFKNCCHKGKVKIPSIRYIPFLQDLLSNPNNEFHSNFMKCIRSYNSSLAFASMGAQISNSLNPGPYCFRVHGQIYHRTSHLYPSTGMPPKFAQLYVLETTQAVNGRLHMKENSGCNEDLLKRLDILIRQNNPFSISFKTLGEIEKEENNRAIQENRPVQKIN